MAIKHVFTSTKADGDDASLVKPSDWNADHVGTQPAASVPIADAGNRYTATEAESALQEIAGAGRTTETVVTRVPTSRQILAGVGLSGGGDLTADRTLSVAIQVLHVQDQKAANTAGGTFTSGAWQTRTLNTVVTNTITGASLASNQITLPAGTYDVEASAPAAIVGRHKCKLYDTTGAADLLIGTSEVCTEATNVENRSFLRGRIVLSVQSVLELRHRCATTYAGGGFGVESNFGVIEVYADVLIRKIA